MPPNRPQYGSIDDFRASKGAKVYALQKFVEGGASSEPGVVDEVVMSTPAVDRAKDVVRPEGFKVERFRSNPVLLWCHDYNQPPVGIVSTTLVDGGALIGRRLVFHPEEINPFGHMVGQMYTHALKFLRAFSVGFLPERWEYDEQRGGMNFLEQELLELSACPIGMNPEALAGAKSAGIDMAPLLPFTEKALDRAPDAPGWLDEKRAWEFHKTLTPRLVQVPLEERLAAVEQQLGLLLERTAPAATTAVAPPIPDISKAAEALRAHVSTKTAELVRRIPQE
jgi:hypothetical protein